MRSEFSGKIVSVMIKEIYVKISKKVTNFIFLPNPVKINIQLVIKGPDICCWRSINHSVESPSMVDPQWNIWYWGSKWNLHTVCWSAVGCEWGTTSVYFGITYVCFIPSRLPVFAVEPQYLLQYFFIFVKSIIWITYTKSSKNFMLV